MDNKLPPCPVCGSSDVKQYYSNNGICGPGGYSWVSSEWCNNCGIELHPGRKLYQKENNE